MKLFIAALFTLILSQNSFAALSSPPPSDPPTWIEPGSVVKLTSFEFPDARNRTAEICGEVVSGTLPGMIRVEVDYDSKIPAIYSTAVDLGGKFCIVAVSLKSRARAFLWHPQATK